MKMRGRQMFIQPEIRKWRCLLAQISTDHVQGYRIKGCQHADIGQNRRIILSMAITIGGYIHNKADMEAGTSIKDCLKVLGDFASQDLLCISVVIFNRIERTCL